MFSLIQKVLKAAQSFDAVSRRVTKIESALAEINTKLERFEKLADENESLWKFLDEQPDEGVYIGSPEEFHTEFSEMMLRNMKPYGDA